MNTPNHCQAGLHSRTLFIPLLALAAAALLTSSARADEIYTFNNNHLFGYDAITAAQITDFGAFTTASQGLCLNSGLLYVPITGATGTIKVYNAGTGALVNTITGLGASVNTPLVVGSTLYYCNGTQVGEYDLQTSTGNASFITGFGSADGLTTIGSTLYVSNNGTAGSYPQTIASFNAATGASINSNVVGGPVVNGVSGVVARGSILYFLAPGQNRIITFDTANPGAGRGTLAQGPGIGSPLYIAADNNTFYVEGFGQSQISEYDGTTGVAISGNLVPWNGASNGVAVGAAPEPTSLGLLACGSVCLLQRRRRAAV